MKTPSSPTQAGGVPSNSPDDTEYGSVFVESHSEKKQLNVFLQSSLEYSLNWRVTMKTRHAYRFKTASKKKLDKSLNLNEGEVRRLVPDKRRTTFDNSNINKDDNSAPDIIDVINSHVAENSEEGSSVQVDDQGLDESYEQCDCSTAPSLLNDTSPKKNGRPPTDLCPSCRKFYQRAKRLKRPIKDKCLDNNPTSLTCDQWVLLKKWAPSRLPHSGKLSHSVRHLCTRLKGKKKEKQDGHQNLCSRLHIFLQRNLRRPRKVPARNERKIKRRKRARDDFCSSQKHHRANNPAQNNSGNDDDKRNFESSRAGLDVEGFHSGESADDSDVTTNIPPTFSLESTKLEAVPRKPKAPAEKTDFHTLLAQLRGSTSSIFKESR
ncbi:uncharacterized protein LOC144044607 isoform X2 [Vanacampus margaritifer]